MPNFAIIDNQGNTLYTLQTNTYTPPSVVSDTEASAAKSGILYIATTGSTSVASGKNLLMQISNPATNGKNLYISRITGGTSVAATLTFYSGGTITGGSTVNAFNTSFGSTNTSSMIATTGVGTLGGSSTSFMSFLAATGIFIIDFSGQLIVPPGKAVTSSIGTGAITASTNVTWWEY